MANYGEEMLTVSCLGRPIRLGMLYDCRNEKVITDVNMWDNNVVVQKSTSKTNPSSDVEVSVETLPTKNYPMSDDLRLSFMCGQVKVSGAAHYLNSSHATKARVCVTLKFACTTSFQELPMNLMAEEAVVHTEVFDRGTATHVVCGVQYGANAVFVFERDVEENEDQNQVEARLKEIVEKIPQVDLKSELNINVSEQDKLETAKVRCSYYGDILNHVPATFEEAVNMFKKLPDLIRMTVDEWGETFGIPVEVCLSPLSQLDDNAARLVHRVQKEDSTKIVVYLEQCSILQSIASCLTSHDICCKFPGIEHQIETFKHTLTKHLSGFRRMLTQILPKIRGGQEDNATLALILSKIEDSPFSSKKMDHWLNAKNNEIAYLSKVCDSLNEFPFAQDSVQLDKLTRDNNVECVVELHFGVVTRKSHSFLTAMSALLKQLEGSDFNYLNVCTDDDDCDEDFHWLCDKGNVSNLQQSVALFKSFATANQNNPNLRFVIGTGFGCKDSRDSPGYMYLHLDERKPFEPPSTPGVPQLVNVAENEIELKWDEPQYGTEFVTGYIVHYKFAQNEDNVSARETGENHNPKIVITSLKEDSSYCFRVAAKCEAGISKFSCWSQPIQTIASPPLGQYVLDLCEQISPAGNGEPAWFQLPLQSTYRNKKVQIQKFDVFEPRRDNPHSKVILLLGATGSGKTTLINGLANYVLGVRMEDNYRFQLITENTNKTQAESQTAAITAYTIHWQHGSQVPFTLTIIDTPGYGDTRGIDHDNIITDQVREFFEMKGPEAIDQLDAIGFVAPASDARLTETQKYVFDSILSIFGKDIAGNIFLMLTFADGRPPPILDAIKVHRLPHQHYFKFNNSVFTQLKSKDVLVDKIPLTSKSTNYSVSKFDSLFWSLATDSFREFFAQLNMVTAKSLKLTREVLQERNRLSVTIDDLQRRIASGVNHLETMRQHLLVIEELKVERRANKNFQRTVQVPKMRKIEFSEVGRYVTNCLNCHVTCHERCGIPDDGGKHGCWAMDGKGQQNACCRICNLKCHWSKHYNKNFYFEEYIDNEVVTLDDLKRNYDTADKNLTMKERLIAGVASKYAELQLAVLQDIETVRRCLARLDEIAMKPNPLTTVDYIEILIENAEREKKCGWQQRILQLQAAKERALMIREMLRRDKEFDPFEMMKQQILDQCKNSKADVFKKIKAILGIDDDAVPEPKPGASPSTSIVSSTLSAIGRFFK